MSTISAHKCGAPVKTAYFAGYDNLFPGTLEMNREVATIIGKRLRQGGFGKLTLDGHESCLATGLGYFAMNDLLKTAFDLNRDRDVLYTSSRISNYCWHMISYISWGEGEHQKGVRGSMLDYRINRQLQLTRSFMPKKLGQHYPTDATLEDINWLMGQAVGWDSGVEFSINLRRFAKNPQYDEIVAAVQSWEKARRSGKITAKQKLVLRVPDDSPTGIRNPVLTTNKGRHCLFPVEIQPAQYLATPVNAPPAFLYDKNHRVIAEIRPRHRNSLPNLGDQTTFEVGCRFEAIDANQSPAAFLNILHSEIIRK